MVGARTRDLRISAQSATSSATMSKGVDPRRANGRYCLIFLTIGVSPDAIFDIRWSGQAHHSLVLAELKTKVASNTLAEAEEEEKKKRF